MGLFTSTTWPTHQVINLYIESASPNKNFLLVLRLSSNGQTQIWKKKLKYKCYVFKWHITNDFLLATLTVLRRYFIPSDIINPYALLKPVYEKSSNLQSTAVYIASSQSILC